MLSVFPRPGLRASIYRPFVYWSCSSIPFPTPRLSDSFLEVHRHYSKRNHKKSGQDGVDATIIGSGNASVVAKPVTAHKTTRSRSKSITRQRRTSKSRRHLVDGKRWRKILGTPSGGARSKKRKHVPASKKARSGVHFSIQSSEQGTPWMSIKEALHAKTDAKFGGHEKFDQELTPADVAFNVIDRDHGEVPRLAHGLSRVLFNRGVVQFRDPHSRVYNFDPSLEILPPVDKVDFQSLSQFTPPSEDKSLAEIAKDSGQRFIGSTSSMTGLLKHFHLLLSCFRNLNFNSLSLLNDVSWTSSKISKAPEAVILRYQDGVYAVDHDKEFDGANVLSLMGRYLEKYFTTDRATFEKYMAGNGHLLKASDVATESYHYSTIGDFLLRSQLDAYDPRLPGTGIFDLKTRAVLPIRMDSEDFEWGMDYEIRTLQGRMSSFEREFADMGRATMLKYSLQARIGRMDGIFVAYHNIARVFGFQYISLNEMDLILHGTEDRTLGDAEFTSSMALLNELMAKAVERFPEQSLRIHCETPETKTRDTLYFFAEPIDQVEIDRIQSSNKDAIQKWEREILGLNIDGSRLQGSQVEQASAISSPHQDIADFRTRARKLQDGRMNSNSEPSTDAETGSTAIATELMTTPESNSQGPSASRGEPHHLPQNVVDGDNTDLQRFQRSVDVDPLDDADRTASAPEEAGLLASDDGLDMPVNGSANALDNATSVALPDTPQTPSKKERKKREAKPVSEPTKPLLALTLRIRNTQDGRRTIRAHNMTRDSEWKITYGIAEIEDEHEAWKLYEACMRRRKAALGPRKKKEAGDVENMFVRQLKEASKAGSVWRGQRDETDRTMEEEKKGIFMWDSDKPISRR